MIPAGRLVAGSALLVVTDGAGVITDPLALGATVIATEADSVAIVTGTLTILVLVATATIDTAGTEEETRTDIASVVDTGVIATELDSTGAGSEDPPPSVKSTHPSYV